MELVEGHATVEDVEGFVTRLEQLGDEHRCTVQAFDARYIVSRAHLECALERADRARTRGEAIARERAVEILLYAAGRRQIERALELGVEVGEHSIVVLVAADDSGSGSDERAAMTAVTELLDAADTLGMFEEARVRDFFDIEDMELAATGAGIEALVCERVALLDVEK